PMQYTQQTQQGIYSGVGSSRGSNEMIMSNINDNTYKGNISGQSSYPTSPIQYRDNTVNQFIPAANNIHNINASSGISSGIVGNPAGVTSTTNINNDLYKPRSNTLMYDSMGHVNSVRPVVNDNYQEFLQFNACSHFIRGSVNYMPANATLKQKTYVPLGFVIQPLAQIPDGYPELASVNFGNSTVVRCKKCRTYINPFVQFEAGGKKWNCNMCYNVNDTPQFYYVPLDEKGKRKDLFQRPELCTGSVDFIAPSDYMIRPPQPPVYLFLIDVTVTSVNSGLLDVVCDTIKKLLPKKDSTNANTTPSGSNNNKRTTFDSRTLIGIMTFDSTIHFYNLNSNLKQTQMLVVSDIQDAFIPLAEDILVNVYECQNVISNLLDNLPNIWRNNKISDSCAGNALKTAFLVLKKIGGKLLFFLSSAPNIGELTVNIKREKKEKTSSYKSIYTSGSGNTSSAGNNSTYDAKLREVEMLTPYNNAYTELAQTITQYQIAVDLFACPLYGIDLASIYPLVKHSGGSLYYYPQFNVHQYSDRLREELLFTLTTEVAWESVMRIRISRGWKITNWYGNFQFRGADLLALPNCHSSQNFSIIVDLEENVVQDTVVYVQSALLYTNTNGERRIRLHTFALPVTQNIKTITDSINPEVVVSLLAHQAIEVCKKGKIADGRNLIQSLCSQVLSSQMLPSNSSRLLPLYILGMLKSLAFRDSGDVPPDVRIYQWARVENISVESIEAYFYPKMFSLHNLEKHHGNYDENNAIILPNTLSLTCENMTQDGCYLLEDAENLLMWIGRSINTQWLYAVFGVHSLDQLDSEYAENHIGTTGDSIGYQVLNIINALRKLRTQYYLRLTVVKQGDPLEYKFFSCLVEDRCQHMMVSLKEFLAKI
ncbi:protein transport protein Sec24A, partial [Hepatocystis sp. ex Piliocolobus tephrosceles]